MLSLASSDSGTQQRQEKRVFVFQATMVDVAVNIRKSLRLGYRRLYARIRRTERTCRVSPQVSQLLSSEF